jgi:adenosylmethionine-8-amino-7-oxononanoate aminotransferase
MDTSFETFLSALARADFAPVEFVRRLEEWCRQHDVVLIFDEVQAGFRRTGKFWAFDHYGVTTTEEALLEGLGVLAESVDANP